MSRPEQIAIPEGLCSASDRMKGICPESAANWFRIENAAGAGGAADILIDGVIVDPFMAEVLGIGVSSTQVVEQILALRGTPLNVWINSEGGIINAGLAIYNQLLMHDAPVTTIVHGMAMSIASVIAMAGGTVIMGPASALFIHEARNELDGTAADHRQQAGILDQLSDQIAAVYARRGDSRINWRAKMQMGSGPMQGTLITAEEAVRLRLADRIDTSLARQPSNLIDPAKYSAVARMTELHPTGSAFSRNLGPAMLLNEAVSVHHADTTDAAWDDATARKNTRSGEDEAYYRDIFAWQDPDKDPTTKEAWSFTHHQVSADGTPGAANMTACSNGIGTLNGGRIQRGDDTPWMADRDGIWEHLAAHLQDGGREPPELQPRDSLNLTPTKRDAERALRDEGFSDRQAKAIVAEGFTAITARDEQDGTAGTAENPEGEPSTVVKLDDEALIQARMARSRLVQSGLSLVPGEV